MDQLEFALIPIGIVLGYGVTKIIGTWAYTIQAWDQQERPPVLYLSSTGLSLFFMYWNFSGLWGYQSVEFEAAQGAFNVTYLFVITLPILLFMLSVSTLIPHDLGAVNDLDAHYFSSARAFHLAFALGIVASFLPDFLPGVVSPTGPDAFMALSVFLGMFLIMAFVKARAIHILIQAALWIILVAISLAFY